MAKGISTTLEQAAFEKGFAINKLLINWQDMSLDEISDLPQIIFAIGDLGAKALKNIIDGGEKFKPIKLVWAGHMLFDSLLAIHSHLSMISLPIHTLTPAIIEIISENKLLPTIGVAHNLFLGDLTRAYDFWNKDLSLPKIPASEKYFGVFLGGDAPLPDGVTQLIFTPTEAIGLAKYVNGLVVHESNTTLLITNSPRTGKFSIDMKIIPDAHMMESAGPYDTPTDLVSCAFIEHLQIPKQRIFFCDFRYGAPSAYKPILALLRGTQGSFALVTGDSTSMVSEIGDFMHKKNIIVARIGSMNAVHHAHVDSLLAVGQLVIHNTQANGFVVEDLPQVADNVAQLSAAMKISKQLCNIISSGSQSSKLTLSI